MTSHPATLFSISPGSLDPIYRQLIDQLRRLIASGQLMPGDALPSVRELAQALAVNPMTVSKSYAMLETEGVLVRSRGVGMLVAPQTARSHHPGQREKLLRPTLEKAAQEARQLELDPAAAVALFAKILKEQR